MKKFFYLRKEKKTLVWLRTLTMQYFFLTPSGMVNEKISLSLFDTTELQTITNTSKNKRKERKARKKKVRNETIKP